MKSFFVLVFIGIAYSSAVLASGTDTGVVEKNIVLQTTTGKIFGTLTTPLTDKKFPVALIIAGSGPTDRNGNNFSMKNNSLKMLSEGLLKHGIATLRYDKRGIAESKASGISEADLRFENYINDARDWIQLLKEDNRFSEIIVIGHSEGSLIGMIVAANADKYISIAGAGQSADKVLKIQLSAQPKSIQEPSNIIIDSLKMGMKVSKINPMLFSLFRPSIQPYMISWFKYDPQVEIGKLTIPVLLIQGTSDIQISSDDVNLLYKAQPSAQLVMIEHMNHIFKLVEGDRQANIATYNNPTLPVAEKLVESIAKFILMPSAK